MRVGNLRVLLFLPLFASCLSTSDGGGKRMGKVTLNQYAAQYSITSCASGYDEFKNSFHPFVKSIRCASCHGVNQSPLYAASDPASSYVVARPRLNNLVDIEQSIFWEHAISMHSGAPIADPEKSIFRAKLQAWASMESRCSSATPTPAPGLTPTPTPTAIPSNRACSPENMISFLTHVYMPQPGIPGSGMMSNYEGRCLFCHAGTVMPSAKASYDLSGNDYTKCVNSARKINRNTPSMSPLLLKGQNTACINRDGPLSPAEAAVWRVWIDETLLLDPP